MKLTKKLLIVLLISLLAVVLFVSTAKAGLDGKAGLIDYLNGSFSLLGETYTIPAAQKQAIIDYINDEANGITDSAAEQALNNLTLAVYNINNSGAASVQEAIKKDSKIVTDIDTAASFLKLEYNVNYDSNTFSISSKSGKLITNGGFSTSSSGKIVFTNGSVGSVNSVKVLEGGTQVYVPSKDNPLRFRFDMNYAYFKDGGKVFVDGNLVNPSNYVSKSGSTIIEFNYDYVKSLSKDWHTLRVEFTNGKSAGTSFLVDYEPGVGGGSGGASVGATAPATYAGNSFVYTGSNNMLYIALSMLAVIATSVAFVKKVNK